MSDLKSVHESCEPVIAESWKKCSKLIFPMVLFIGMILNLFNILFVCCVSITDQSVLSSS